MRVRLVVFLIFAALGCASASGQSTEASVCAALATGGTGLRLAYVKAEHQLCLFRDHEVIWERRASHGRESGRKRYEGDGRTPEGKYTVSIVRTSSRFGSFMRISYPDREDVTRAQAEGKEAGGDIGIHGPQRWYAFLGRAQAWVDHSDGCIVLDAAGMQALAGLVKTPIPIEILPALRAGT